MVSTRNKGVIIDTVLLEKKIVSGRVPKYVIKYAKEHKISISDLIMAGFDSYREMDVKHAIERLSYHENRVLHWRGIVLHNESECNTKYNKCNTIRELFIKNGRGHPYDKQMDMSWLEGKNEELLKEGIVISVEELYDYCTKKEIK